MRWNFLSLIFQYCALALNTILTKIMLRYADSQIVFFCRYFISGIFLFLACSGGLSKQKALFLTHPWFVVRSALLQMTIPALLIYWATKEVSAAHIMLFNACTPFISYFLAYMFLHEKITMKKNVGLLIGLLGMVPLLMNKYSTGNSNSFRALPELALFCGFFSVCLSDVNTKRLIMRYPEVSTYALAAHDSFFGALFIIPYFFTPLFSLKTAVREPQAFFLWCLLAIFLNMISRPLFAWHLKQYGNTFLSLASLSLPFITAFFGQIFLQEIVTKHFFGSLFCVIVGCLLFYHDQIPVTTKSKLY